MEIPAPNHALIPNHAPALPILVCLSGLENKVTKSCYIIFYKTTFKVLFSDNIEPAEDDLEDFYLFQRSIPPGITAQWSI